jgi:DNA-binding transcriptional MerR regulator
MASALLSIGMAARMLGVSTKTLRRWDDQDTFKPEFRLPSGHRFYSRAQVKTMLDEARERANPSAELRLSTA